MSDHDDNFDKLKSKYKLLIRLGQGSFGSVYRAAHRKTRREYAVKIEEKNSRSRLKNEYSIYKNLIHNKIDHGIPEIKEYLETDKSICLVMQLLGKSLDLISNESEKPFDLGTVLKLGIDITDLLEKIHNAGYIHRDIKPNNFLIGITEDDFDEIFIMDFGLSKKYITDDGSHIKMKEDRSLVGTARYASINVHMGLEPSRRDDLESVGYMLVYFLKKVLPWQGLKTEKNADKVKIIGECKMNTSLHELCKGLPPCFMAYITYCRNLKFDEKPDYRFLKKLLFMESQKLRVKLEFFWSNDR